MQTILIIFGVLAACQISSGQQGYDYSSPGSFPATGTTVSQTFPVAQSDTVPNFANNRPSSGFAGSSSFNGAPAISNPPFIAPAAIVPTASTTGFPARPAVSQVTRPVVGSSNIGFPSNAGGFGSVPSNGRPASIPTFQGTGRPIGSQSNFGVQSTNGNDQSGDYSAIPGEPGRDYPIYSEIPITTFDCNNQPWPGYYADLEAQCQIFHVCALNKTFDFLCPNGTIFSQELLVCVWWNQFDCSTAPSLYGGNAGIYDYSQSGPSASNGIQADTFPNAPKPIATGFPRPSINTNRPGASSVGFSTSQTATAFPNSPGASASPARPSPPSNTGPPYSAFPSNVISQGSSSYPLRPGQSGTVYPSTPTSFPVQNDQFSVTAQNPTRDYLPPRQG